MFICLENADGILTNTLRKVAFHPVHDECAELSRHRLDIDRTSLLNNI